MPKKKQVPPSRKRYDQQHPTVSARVPLQIYDQLQRLKSLSGKSLADVLMEALNRQKPSTELAYIRGLLAGREEASEFRVEYPCAICGVIITVKSSREKEAIASYMVEHGWGHQACRR